MLGDSAADSGSLQTRGTLAAPPTFGSSALSHLARLRLETRQPAAQQQLHKQLFAGLEHAQVAPGYQYIAGLQSQQLLQQLSLLLQQQQQQQAQQAVSMAQVRKPALSHPSSAEATERNFCHYQSVFQELKPLAESPELEWTHYTIPCTVQPMHDSACATFHSCRM